MEKARRKKNAGPQLFGERSVTAEKNNLLVCRNLALHGHTTVTVPVTWVTVCRMFEGGTAATHPTAWPGERRRFCSPHPNTADRHGGGDGLGRRRE